MLRDRIANGERPDVFASANLEHPQSLVANGWSPAVTRFARNRRCVLTAPGVALKPETVLDVLLDPRIKVGTSTPKAGPSGDYAFEVFRRVQMQRKGAFSVPALCTSMKA